MMGDNRRNSQDSRFWGSEKIRGQGKIVFWSHNPEKSLFKGYNLKRVGRLLR